MIMKMAQSPAAPKTPASNLKRILVPIDFSSAAQAALEYAVGLASKFEARITLIHVVEYFSGPYDPTFGHVPVDHGAQIAALARRLERIASEQVPAALLETTLVRRGVPYHQITGVAKELNMDLIVITTHGHTGLAHVILGSTAERIVRHASCPVLTVRGCSSVEIAEAKGYAPRIESNNEWKGENTF
jgi:universal stress protein A